MNDKSSLSLSVSPLVLGSVGSGASGGLSWASFFGAEGFQDVFQAGPRARKEVVPKRLASDVGGKTLSPDGLLIANISIRPSLQTGLLQS